MRTRADRIEGFESLNRDSVALLAPLYDPGLRERPTELAAAICDAVADCARSAESVGVRSLAYLSNLIAPYVRSQAGQPAWPDARERIEAWIGDVVAFCAGQFPASDAACLATQTQSWPDFPEIPDQLLSLIVGRLTQDAGRLATLADDAQGVQETQEMQETQGARASAGDARAPISPSLDAAASAPIERRRVNTGERATEVARDELAMLSEAATGLEDEFGQGLVEISAGRLDAPVAAEIADLHRERLANLANASRYVGLDVFARLLDLCCESLSRWHADPLRFVAADGASTLSRLPAALRAYLDAPSVDSARALARLIASDAWPVALAHESVEPVAIELGRLALVASRQVEVRDTDFEEDELSLAIPPDADSSVVENLLRELPALSTQFGAHLERFVAGEAGEVLAAQRIAHTLKGAANTVGIRGVATLTHLLEDLLHAIHESGVAPGIDLADLLGRAADCLAEMTDAVAGIGAPPMDRLDVCRALAGWVARMVDGAPRGEAVPEAAAEQALDSVGDPWRSEPGPPHEEPDQSQDEPGQSYEERGQSPEEPGPPSAEPAYAGGEEMLRVPASLVDRMLDLAGEAAILMSQVHEQVSRLSETRSVFRQDTDRLMDLSSDLERLVDIRGVALAGRRASAEFDPLELDEFDELHTVSRRIAESGADGKLLGQLLDRQGAEIADVVARLERVQGDLRDSVMRSRMVGVSTVAPRLRRAVRQAARMSGKQVELAILGEPMAVDAHLLQTLLDPLAHLLRNAVDHGIEPAELRRQRGKPALGRIELSFERVGHSLAIVCRDDGAGLDLGAVRARALEQGLLTTDAAPSDAELAQLILQPGFTTRRTASQLSGRGFGMDVVSRCVAALRGSIGLASEAGAGVEVSITIPERMISIPVVVARTASHVLALSIRGVEGIVSGGGAVRDDRGALRFVHGDGMLDAFRLDELLGLPGGFLEERQPAPAPGASGSAEVALLVRRPDGRLVAVISPQLGQTRNLVLRPLPSWLPAVWAVDGAAVLGDGAVAPVIDLPTLVSPEAPVARALPVAESESRPMPVCLAVDDSVSVRRSMQAFLSDIGLEVMAAGDGVDALALVDRKVPDIAIVDLEMPRMNGVELSRALRADPRTSGIPIIMITSRYSDKHRAMALEAGADVFMTKPYTEDELASRVRSCLEQRRPLG